MPVVELSRSLLRVVELVVERVVVLPPPQLLPPVTCLSYVSCHVSFLVGSQDRPRGTIHFLKTTKRIWRLTQLYHHVTHRIFVFKTNCIN